MIVAERCAEIALCPNEWHFWRTRRAKAAQVLRWCKRVDDRFEVDVYENLKIGEQRIKVRVRLRVPAELNA